MSQRLLIGLSSGSGLGGIDAALVRVEGIGLDMTVHLERLAHQPHSREVRDLLRAAATNVAMPVRTVALLHRVLGDSFANAVRQLLDDAKLDSRGITCIGCSGHTLWHEPDGRFPTTLNAGVASAVAERTGLTTLTDPRSADVLAGGHGALVTALADWLLFRSETEPRVLIHLGGAAALVALPAACRAKQVIGFHAAPCGMLLDGFMRHLTGGRESFDSFGKHAVQGCCIEPLLERWLAHPLLHRKPPKIVAARDFGEEFIAQAAQWARQMDRSLHDLLCTTTHFVARATVEALRRFVPWPPHRVLVSGGGVHNGFLWRLLEQQLAPLRLEKTDACGVPCQARKAIAFAALAALTLDAAPGNLPAVTGASGARLLGSITPGNPNNWSACVAWMARQTAMPRLAAA
jgi:anhydro-N-acetylmuramic acid kinase